MTESLDEFAARKLRSLERRALHREIQTIDRTPAARIRLGDRDLVSFSCNDYLGLGNDPKTIRASIAATEALGTGAGASRLISGSHSLYRELESSLAALKQTEAALVFGSGYLANVGIIPLFAKQQDLILIDALAHSSMLTGAQLSGARVESFAHNDAADLDRILAAMRQDYRHCLVLTEGVFSMDGDLAPLPELAQVAAAYSAWMMTDDAHALGVVGGGRGSSFAHGDPIDVPLQMGTLSKAVGAYGGYLCASREVIDLVRNRARSFVYSTGLPPGTIAAATQALAVIRDDSARVARPLELARRFTAAMGLPAAESAIVPLLIGANAAALEASAALKELGFFAHAIRPPTVPPGTARLRLTFSAAHSLADVDGLIAACRELGLDRPAK